MPVDLNSLTEGWLELESDPGLFTLLLEDFGVRGVQVEEVYDLQKPIEGPVYGFIFLFKWSEERRSRRKPFVTDESFVQDEEIVNSIFFAQQIVPNSCATHALLSVLLNCNKIHLGETLTRLKEYTKNMSPENKGLAIGNTPELAKAHNSHAKPEPRRLQEKSQGFTTSRTMEAFHFVSYVPIGGQLFELDGLKPYPNNHGPWGEHEDWTEKFRCVMKERLGVSTGGGHDIRFNLMAVVPCRRMAYEHKLRTLKTNRQIVLEALQQLVKMTHPELTSDDRAEYMAAVIRSKQQNKASPGSVNEMPSAPEEQMVGVTEGSSVPAITASSGRTSMTERCSSPFKSKTSTRSSTTVTSYMVSHPALDSHNYAKSPLMEGITEEEPSRPRYEDYSGSDYTSEEDNAGGCPSSKEVPPPPPPAVTQPIQINTKDYSHPLSIQTKFEASPTPSNSSTDTSSEVGSAFNSPVRTVAAGSAQSPTFCHGRDIKKFLVIRMTGGKDPADEATPTGAALRSATLAASRSSSADGSSGHDTRQSEGANKRPSFASRLGEEDAVQIPSKRAASLSSPSSSYSERSLRSNKDENSPPLYRSRHVSERSEGMSVSSDRVADIREAMGRSGDGKKDSTKYPQLIEPHSFAPKDLLALLKNVENEILNCESNLKDEIEKRKKYKVDDCRRTHNYDRFICSFLSMLAQQGKLADLVDKHVLVKRRQGITVGRLHKKTDRRRRSRTKKRK